MGFEFTVNSSFTVGALDSWLDTGTTGGALEVRISSALNPSVKIASAIVDPTSDPLSGMFPNQYYSPAITYVGEVSALGQGNTPTSDDYGGSFDDGVFAPNFEGTSTPEPASLASALMASVFGLGYAARRKFRGRAN